MRPAIPRPRSPHPEGALQIRRLPVSQRSLATYGLLVAVLLACKLVFALRPVSYYLRDQASAFAWMTLLAIIVFGCVGLLLAPRAGFPDMWDDRVSNTRRFVIPTVDGIVYGLVTIFALDLLNPSDVHIAFPASILFDTYGGIFLETLLRLFGLTLLTWLLAAGAGAVKIPHGDEVSFWIANVVVSLYEPMPFIQQQLANTPTRWSSGSLDPLGVRAALPRESAHRIFLPAFRFSERGCAEAQLLRPMARCVRRVQAVLAVAVAPTRRFGQPDESY